MIVKKKAISHRFIRIRGNNSLGEGKLQPLNSLCTACSGINVNHNTWKHGRSLCCLKTMMYLGEKILYNPVLFHPYYRVYGTGHANIPRRACWQPLAAKREFPLFHTPLCVTIATFGRSRFGPGCRVAPPEYVRSVASKTLPCAFGSSVSGCDQTPIGLVNANKASVFRKCHAHRSDHLSCRLDGMVKGKCIRQ